jgi:hypothetical protein
MNPAIANPGVDRVALTERLKSLDGKTLYLVDINWGGPDAAYGVFEEMKIWFNENMPKVNVIVKEKQAATWPMTQHYGKRSGKREMPQ